MITTITGPEQNQLKTKSRKSVNEGCRNSRRGTYGSSLGPGGIRRCVMLGSVVGTPLTR